MPLSLQPPLIPDDGKIQVRMRPIICFIKEPPRLGFAGGSVVKNPPANAGDTGSSPGPGRSHMPWSN